MYIVYKLFIIVMSVPLFLFLVMEQMGHTKVAVYICLVQT